MLTSSPSRSLSLDGLHLVGGQESGRTADELSVSADSLHAPPYVERPLVVGGIAPSTSKDLGANRRQAEVSRLAWEMSNKFGRRSQAARQVALRTAAILHMRKNSTALKVACIEDKHCTGACRPAEGGPGAAAEPDVQQLRNRLSSLDLQLQQTNQDAQQQLHLLQCSHEQHLQLLRELGELEGRDCCPETGECLSDPDLLASSLPCLAMPALTSPKSRKHDRVTGLKQRVAKGSAWGRVLGSRLHRSSEPSHSSFSLASPLPPLPPHHQHQGGGSSHHGHGKRGSIFYGLLHSSAHERPHCAGQQGSGAVADAATQMEGYGGGPEQHEVDEDLTRTEISSEALAEIAAFKQLIAAFFADQALQGLH